MWDSSPSEQEIHSVSGRSDIFESHDIFANGGSSGSPLFRSYSYIENGTLKRKAYHFGVAVTIHATNHKPSSEYAFDFDYSRFTKNTHFALNLYHVLEDTGNEIEA